MVVSIDHMAIWPYKIAVELTFSRNVLVAMKPDDFKERARIGKALSHPARLLIISVLLDKGDQCVGDLVKLVGSDQSTVSKHLAVLKSVGIVEDRREGSRVVYRLLTPCVKKFFECVEGVRKAQIKRMGGKA